MSTHVLLAALLTPLPMNEDSPLAELRPSAVELRVLYRSVLHSDSPRSSARPEEYVPAMAALYVELGRSNELAGIERVRMRRALKARLEKARDRLLREQLAERRRPARSVQLRTTAELESVVGLAGPAERAQGQQLVNLIQSVIAPESWEVNGGRGSITYWDAWHVLVVRQTGDVHAQVGGLLNQFAAGR